MKCDKSLRMAEWEASPGQVLGCAFNDLSGRQLCWSLAHWAIGNEILAKKENLLIPDDQIALFLSPGWVAGIFGSPWDA